MTAPRPDQAPQLPTRYDVEWAAEASVLGKCARDVVFALCRRMEQGSTIIPGRYSPSLRGLAAATGWSKRHVQRALNTLEALQVVSRLRPTLVDARRKHARTHYVVNLERLRSLERGLGTQGPQEGRDSTSPPLGTVRPMAGDSTTPGHGTGGREARDTVAHSQISPERADLRSDPEIDMVIKTLRDRTGKTVSEEWAARTRDLILARPGSASQRPLGYIRRVLMLDKQPDRWLPTYTPPPIKEDK